MAVEVRVDRPFSGFVRKHTPEAGGEALKVTGRSRVTASLRGSVPSRDNRRSVGSSTRRSRSPSADARGTPQNRVWPENNSRGAATRGERACLIPRLHRGREHHRTTLAWTTRRNELPVECAVLARRDAHARETPSVNGAMPPEPKRIVACSPQGRENFVMCASARKRVPHLALTGSFPVLGDGLEPAERSRPWSKATGHSMVHTRVHGPRGLHTPASLNRRRVRRVLYSESAEPRAHHWQVHAERYSSRIPPL